VGYKIKVHFLLYALCGTGKGLCSALDIHRHSPEGNSFSMPQELAGKRKHPTSHNSSQSFFQKVATNSSVLCSKQSTNLALFPTEIRKEMPLKQGC
jgi:hypothetical protein